MSRVFLNSPGIWPNESFDSLFFFRKNRKITDQNLANLKMKIFDELISSFATKKLEKFHRKTQFINVMTFFIRWSVNKGIKLWCAYVKWDSYNFFSIVISRQTLNPSLFCDQRIIEKHSLQNCYVGISFIK